MTTLNYFLIEYGHIPAYIILILIGVFWISIPNYLSECALTNFLMDKFHKNKKLHPNDLKKTVNNIPGIKYAFGRLPKQNDYPELYKNPVFLKHIKELKILQKLYKKYLIVCGILILILFMGRVYVVQLKRKNNKEMNYSRQIHQVLNKQPITYL